LRYAYFFLEGLRPPAALSRRRFVRLQVIIGRLRKKLTPQEEPGVWERIREGFSENLERVAVGTRDFLIGVIVDIPYLVIWGIVLFLGFLIGKKVVKKKGFWSFKKFRSKGKKDSEEK